MKETPLLMGLDSALFGVCNEAKSPAGCGVIIFNAGLLHHVGPYRLHVTLARELAELGCSTIRLDQSGKGESPMRKGLSSDEALLRDFDDTVEVLDKKGATAVFLVGLCSGADDALFIAQHRSNVSGLILLDGYARRTRRFYFNHYRRRIFKTGPWLRALRSISLRVLLMQDKTVRPASIIDVRNWSGEKEMTDRFIKLIERGTSVMAVFTRGVEAYYNYQGQLAESLALSQERNGLTEVYYPDAEHTFNLVAHRARLIDEIRRWLAGQMKLKL